MSGTQFLDLASSMALCVLVLSLFLSLFRLVRGPTLADRVLALDLSNIIALAFVVTLAARTGFSLYVDIALAIGLVGFLATLALARFLLMQGGIDAAASRQRLP